MEKILALILALTYGAWYLTAEPANKSIPSELAISSPVILKETKEVKVEKAEKIVDLVAVVEESEIKTVHMTQEEMHNKIKYSCENAGWIVTEFKNNAIIAEKIDENSTLAITVKFDGSSFELSPQNSDLKAIISAKLNH